MNKLDQTNRILTRFFLLMFEVALLLRLVVLYSLIDSRFDSLLFTVVSLIGAAILGTNLLIWFRDRKIPNVWLMLFILAMLISTIMVKQASLFSNFKMVIWQALYFFVVYYIGKNKDDKLLSWFENVLFWFWTVAVVLSLGLFVIRFTYTQPLKQIYYGMRLGIVQNRLYGIFVDPNYAANLSAIASVLMIKRICTTVGRHWLYYVAIVLNFLYMVLSGSRSVMLDMSAVILISLFLLFHYRFSENQIWLKWLKSLAIGVAGVILFLGVGEAVKVVMPHLTIPTHVDFLVNISKGDNDQNVSLERSDVEDNSDSSNGRVGLWQSAVQIFESSPIYGASPRNFVDYAKAELPKTKIAKTHQSPHNFFLLTLLATGLLGTIPLVGFLVMRLYVLVKNLFLTRGIEDISYILNSMIVVQMLLFSCLMPDLMLENRIGALCFWLFLGIVTFGKTPSSQERVAKFASTLS